MSEIRKVVISISLLLTFCSVFAGTLMFFYGDYEGAIIAALSFTGFFIILCKGLFDKPEGR